MMSSVIRLVGVDLESWRKSGVHREAGHAYLNQKLCSLKLDYEPETWRMCDVHGEAGDASESILFCKRAACNSVR